MISALLLGIPFYIISIIFGIALANFFLSGILEKRIFIYAAGIPIGFVASSYMALALEAAIGTFTGLIMAAVVLTEAVLCYFMLRNRRASKLFDVKQVKLEYRHSRGLHISILIVSFVLIVFQAFALTSSNGTLYASSNYGTDLLFHLGVGQSLIYSGFPPTYLYSYTAKNVFPFITDFYSAMLYYAGFGVVLAFNAMNFLLWFSFSAMLIFFFNLIARNYKIAAAAVPMFLFFSLGFNFLLLYYFNIGLPELSAAQIQQYGQQSLINLLQYPYFNFSDPFISNFVIQHDYLLGFPYTLIVISSLYILFLDPKTKKEQKKGMLQAVAFLGLMVGLMPLIHPFSLEFVFVFSLVAFFYYMANKYNERRNISRQIIDRLVPWLVFGVIVTVVALPLMYYILSQHVESGFIWWIVDQGFWYPSNPTVLNIIIAHAEFWLEVAGIMLPLGLIGLRWFRKESLVAFLPAVITFAAVNFFSLQPSIGDNNKTTVYFFMFIALASMILLYKIFTFRKGPAGIPFKILAIALFFFATFSGLISDTQIFTGPYTLATPLVFNTSAWIINNTSPHAVFQSNCYTYTYDFVSTLAGRDSLLDIYIYSDNVGIVPKNYSPDKIAESLPSFFSAPSCGLVDEYNISYVVLENITQMGSVYNCEQANWSAFSNSSDFQLVYHATDNSSSQISIFKTHC